MTESWESVWWPNEESISKAESAPVHERFLQGKGAGSWDHTLDLVKPPSQVLQQMTGATARLR